MLFIFPVWRVFLFKNIPIYTKILFEQLQSSFALPSTGTHAPCFPPWLATLCHTFKASQMPPRPPRALLILELCFFLWFILPLPKDFPHIMRQSTPKFTCYSLYSLVSGTALRPKAILRSSWKKKKKKRMNECHLNCYAQSPSLQNWENKTSTAMQKHKGVYC